MTARALLDTSVLIDMPEDLSALAGSVAVSLVSVAELQYGLAVERRVDERAVRRRRLGVVLDRFEIIAMDLTTTAHYGQLARLVTLAHRSPRGRRFDLLIAASAARHDIPILTRNPDDLRGLARAITVIAVM